MANVEVGGIVIRFKFWKGTSSTLNFDYMGLVAAGRYPVSGYNTWGSGVDGVGTDEVAFLQIAQEWIQKTSGSTIIYRN